MHGSLSHSSSFSLWTLSLCHSHCLPHSLCLTVTIAVSLSLSRRLSLSPTFSSPPQVMRFDLFRFPHSLSLSLTLSLLSLTRWLSLSQSSLFSHTLSRESLSLLVVSLPHSFTLFLVVCRHPPLAFTPSLPFTLVLTRYLSLSLMCIRCLYSIKSVSYLFLLSHTHCISHSLSRSSVTRWRSPTFPCSHLLSLSLAVSLSLVLSLVSDSSSFSLHVLSLPLPA